jgi:hypothetical protein
MKNQGGEAEVAKDRNEPPRTVAGEKQAEVELIPPKQKVHEAK